MLVAVYNLIIIQGPDGTRYQDVPTFMVNSARSLQGYGIDHVSTYNKSN